MTALVAANVAVCAAGRTQAQEMACCKAGHRTCGKMTSASDCCKSKERSSPTAAVTKQPDAVVEIALPAGVPALFQPDAPQGLATPVCATLKRPHDPPHLHTFSLLI